MVTSEDGHRAEAIAPDVSGAGFRPLAAFRHRIRQFLHFSEEAARSQGIEPQQHQVLLALKGLPRGTRPTIAALSRQLCLRHHSTVELINRLVDHGAVRRRQGEQDHREVLIELTSHGEELLQRLAVVHREELRVSGPALCESLQAVVRHGSRSRGRLE
ncbi:MAG: MarR family transcriptional regulator [Acidobacteriaceae bacterium]|nr:MarR family transcriptional regulator [Acidobacteriaceae bacterium]